MPRALLFLGIALVFASASARAERHRIEPGQTLTEISLLTRQSVEELTSLNRIANPDSISAGDSLFYVSVEDSSDALDYCRYVVRAGKTHSRYNDASDFIVRLIAGGVGIANPEFEAMPSCVLVYAMLWTGLTDSLQRTVRRPASP